MRIIPLFFTTSKTAISKNRLNWRAKALLENNITAIKNKRILDLASHDGRFSYAAVKLGATFVKGIEGRPYLVQYAIQNFQKYKIPSTLYSFEVGDIFKKLEEVTPGSFDTILCLGIFYHVLHHARLLELIERTQAQFLILDT